MRGRASHFWSHIYTKYKTWKLRVTIHSHSIRKKSKKSPIKENQKSVTQKPVRDKWIIVIACNTHPVLFHFIILKWCSKATLIYNSRAFIKQFDGTANTRGSHGLHSCTLMTLLYVVNRRDSWVLAKHRRIAYMLYISPCHRVLLVSYNNGLFNSAKVCQN